MQRKDSTARTMTANTSIPRKHLREAALMVLRRFDRVTVAQRNSSLRAEDLPAFIFSRQSRIHFPRGDRIFGRLIGIVSNSFRSKFRKAFGNPESSRDWRRILAKARRPSAKSTLSAPKK